MNFSPADLKDLINEQMLARSVNGSRRIFALAQEIEKNNQGRSSWPKMFHPILRIINSRAIARDTAAALREVSLILADHEQILREPQPPPSRGQAGDQNGAFPPMKRLLVDVTYTNRRDERTGIQRVVRNLSRELSQVAPVPVILVRVDHGCLERCLAFEEKIGLVPTRTEGENSDILVPKAGDVLLLADSGWPMLSQYLPVFQEIRQAGGAIVSIIYDLIPLTHPEVMHNQAQCRQFASWMAAIFEHSALLIAISETTAQAVLSFADGTLPALKRALPVSYFHLGSKGTELAAVEGLAHRQRFLKVRKSARQVFLMVGTVEARKNHACALAAFELLWAKGGDASLCIVGKRGWQAKAVTGKILAHRMYGKKLFWFPDATDADLASAYATADCLLATSIVEGFGLPLIEAAHQGVPIIASDIPVFREVCQSHATYFRSQDPEHLAEVLRQWIETKLNGRELSSKDMPYLSWQASARALLNVILAQDWKYRILPPNSETNRNNVSDL